MRIDISNLYDFPLAALFRQSTVYFPAYFKKLGYLLRQRYRADFFTANGAKPDRVLGYLGDIHVSFALYFAATVGSLCQLMN